MRRAARAAVSALVPALAAASVSGARAQAPAAPEVLAPRAVAPFTVVDGAIPAPLTGAPGDPARGRAIVADRTRGLCLLCHRGPFPEERFQGDLAPDLAGVGDRLSAGALRLRIADGRQLNPGTIMPAYHSLDGLTRVGAAWRGRPILDAAEVEDVVAYLATLRGADAGTGPEGER